MRLIATKWIPLISLGQPKTPPSGG